MTERLHTAAISGSKGSSGLGLLSFSCIIDKTKGEISESVRVAALGAACLWLESLKASTVKSSELLEER